MNLRRLSFQATIGAWAILAIPDLSHAQSSSGLVVLSAGVKHDQRTITAKFVASNNSRSRIYIRNTSFDNTEIATLESGETLRYPVVSGISDCRHDLNNCLGQSGNNLSEYTYIDPGQHINFSILYRTQNPVNDNDSITISVSLVVRYASVNDPTQTGGTRRENFNFNDKSVNK